MYRSDQPGTRAPTLTQHSTPTPNKVNKSAPPIYCLARFPSPPFLSPLFCFLLPTFPLLLLLQLQPAFTIKHTLHLTLQSTNRNPVKMKLSVLSAALLPVLIHAQAIPDCATACLSSAIVAASCTPGDNACACTPAKQAEIGTAGTSCLLSSCSAEEIPAVIAAGSAACSSYSATLSGSASEIGRAHV